MYKANSIPLYCAIIQTYIGPVGIVQLLATRQMGDIYQMVYDVRPRLLQFTHSTALNIVKTETDLYIFNPLITCPDAVWEDTHPGSMHSF